MGANFKASGIFSAEKIIKRSGLSCMGLADAGLDRSLVLIFCEDGCQQEAEIVKQGVTDGGASGIVLTLPTLSDLTADGFGKSWLLFAREAVADLTESLLNMYSADGCALIAKSESAAAGMVMGAIRRNVPLVFLPAFLRGLYYPSRMLMQRSLVAAGQATLSELELEAGEISMYRSVEMDSFNGFCLFLEACGLAVKNSVGAWSATEKTSAAWTAGTLAAGRAISLSYPRKQLTAETLSVGVLAFLASGGEAASLVNILAIAAENRTNFSLADIEKLGEKLPLLAGISPLNLDFAAQSATQSAAQDGSVSKYNIVDFVQSGGVFAVLSQLSKVTKLPACTLFEETLAKKLSDSKAAGEAIQAASTPTPTKKSGNSVAENGAMSGGFGFLDGNLIDVGLCSRACSGVFKGEAIVFDSEEHFRAAVFSKSIADGSAVVLRGFGAREKGLPFVDLSPIAAVGLKNVLVITDTRVVCEGNSRVVSLCCGGALPVVSRGDMIEIDFKKGKASLIASTKELNGRLKKIRDIDSAMSGGLHRYAHLVTDLNNGFILRQKL